MSDPSPQPGRFVWHELHTSDPDAARDFYAALFGWTPSVMEMGPEPYTMFMDGDVPRAGMVRAMDGVSPGWESYATVDNVDRSLERAAELGAAVKMTGHDIPGIGRMGILDDLHGATICPFTFAGDAPPEDETFVPGQFCWDELHTPDPEAAKAFYGKLFGWTYTSMDMGEFGTYWIANRGARGAAGIMQLPPGVGGPPRWLPAVWVEDVDAGTAAAGTHGATVQVPASDIPGVGRYAVFTDPQGALLSLYRGRTQA